MKRHLAKFENEAAYDVFKAGEDFVTPNVSWCVGENIVKWNPYVAPTPPSENNKIYYTSTTGEIIIPAYLDENNDSYEWIHEEYPDINDVFVFGANIVSNTYENGQGVITFDGNVTLIGFCAFASCYDLSTVTIPDSVTTIGDNAFDSCIALSSITIPDSVITIGNYAFIECQASSITIPDSVTTIGKNAFNKCEELSSVTLGSGVTSIEFKAFAGCGISSITIPDSVTTIGDDAFGSCEALSSVTIPDSVTTIGGGAFSFCRALSSITIPDSVTTIGDGAFGYCTSLSTINYEGTMSQWNNITIGNDWNDNVPATVVHCTDGDVSL